MGGRRSEIANAHFDGPPTARPIGQQVTADAAMEFGGEAVVGRPGGKLRLVERRFNAQDAFSQKRGYFRKGEDTASGFEEAGGAIWSSISCRR